jgi:hypothetical protein
MHKFAFAIALATALTLAGTAGWIATTTHAQAPVSGERIDPSQIDRNARNLPVEHPNDLTFVF